MEKMNFEMSLAIENELSIVEMEEIQAGSACGFVTGALCFTTIALASSVVTAPLAAASGVGCLVGYFGCN